MQHIKLQPEIGLAEVQDIVDTIADKEDTALKLFLKGELVFKQRSVAAADRFKNSG